MDLRNVFPGLENPVSHGSFAATARSQAAQFFAQQNGRRKIYFRFALTRTVNAILHQISREKRLIRCIFSGEVASALRFPPGSRPEKIVHYGRRAA